MLRLRRMISGSSRFFGGFMSWFISCPPPAAARSAIIFSMLTSVDQSSDEAFQVLAFPFS